MRQLMYSMQFTGQATPVEGSPNVLKATTFAPSCTMTTVIDASGVNGAFEPIAGERATFESEVVLSATTAFQERGTITFGLGHDRLRFGTVGEGYLAASADPRCSHGCVIWRIEEGEGRFAGATGLITSNFTVSEIGAVTDNHFGVIYLP